MITQNSQYAAPLHIFFHYTWIMEKAPYRGLYTFCDHPYLVSLCFADVVSLYQCFLVYISLIPRHSKIREECLVLGLDQIC